MKPVFLLAAMLSMSVLTASAERVQSRAGELSDIITDHSVTELTVSGSVNAADVDFINSRLTCLTTLDLSGCTVEAYRGKALSWGRTESEANTLPEYSLMGSPVTTLSLPAGLTALADGCLAASAVTELVIPEGVDSIGTAMCDGCAALTAVRLPSALKSVPRLAFRNCQSLTALTMPPGLETIGDDAFNGCSSLAEVKFPASLTSIGDNAFAATALTEVSLAECESLGNIGSWVFARCGSLESVSLPRAARVGEGVFFDCGSLRQVSMAGVPSALSPYLFKGTALASLDGLLADGVTVIDRYSFYGNGRVTEATLPAGVTRLGDRAMAAMGSLTQLDASQLSALPELGEGVFDGTSGPGVRLLASALMAPVFELTPQWQEFDVVVKDSAGAAGVMDDNDESLRLRYSDNTLYVEASAPLARATLYDLQGRVAARAQADDGSNTVTLTAIPLTRGSIAVVGVEYDDGTHTTIKTRF